MSTSHDQSYLDRKYFIDNEKYNCPFCNRKSITYSVEELGSFNWSNTKSVYLYRVTCGGSSCEKVSLHFSSYNIHLSNEAFKWFSLENKTTYTNDVEIDNLFFYHQPTTFFTLDTRINEKVRNLISEAEGCSKMNYLVGASGCLRKAIYQLLELEQVSKNNSSGKSLDYGERVKILKSKYTTVPAEYFDALANIQGMTSEQLHEGDWKAFTQGEFTFIVEAVKEILTEIYVRPQEKASVLSKILALKPQKEIQDNVSSNKKITRKLL